MAGAGSPRATQRRICCAQASRRPRESGYIPRRPMRYRDGGGRARYPGYAKVRRVILHVYCAVQSTRADAAPLGGGGGGGTVQPRPDPRLRSRLARTSLRGGRAPGPRVWPRRAGPAYGGGGGTSSRPRGSDRGAPLLGPRAYAVVRRCESRHALPRPTRAPAGPSALRPVLWAQPPPPLPCIRPGARAML